MVSVLWMQVVRADEKWATSEILHKQLNVFFVHLLSLEEKSIEIVPVRSDQFTALHMEANDECHSNITTACAEKTCNQPKSDEILQPLKTQYYLMEGVDLNRCKSMACYVLCQILRHSDVGGCVGCWNSGLLGAASSLLDSPSAELRSWSCLVLAQLLFSLRFAKNFVSQKCTTHLDMFTHLLQDKSPIVRSSCVTLLSSLVGFCAGETPDEQSIRRLQMEKTLLIKLRGIVYDPSVIVRQELIHFACTVLFHYGGLLPPLQDTDATSRYMDYMQEVGRRFPSWALDEPDVNVKSMLNTSRPTANRCFDSAGVFAKVTQIDHDMCEAPSMPFKESDIPPEGLALLRGMVHDASLMLFTLYQACDKERVTSALGRLSDNGRPQSQRFESEALRSMSRVVSAYSTHFVSEADRACVTRNSDSMQRIVLDLQDHRVETLPPRQSATDRTKPLSAGGDTVIPTVGDDKGNMYASSIHHQVLLSLVPCDQVICATFRALETSMVLATKSQRIYHTSYESYNTQKQIHSFQVHLAAPLHDILVINDASERPGLLLVNQRGGYSLVRDCWGKSSVSPTEVAAFCVCPPLRTVCIKSAYRSHNANLFCGGPIGYGGGTEIHILSLAEEQVIQKLKVSGDPTITSLTTHTTGRAVFAGCSDGVVRYYDDRQKQGFLGAVVALRCRTSPSSGVESVVGAGPVEKDVAALTVAISSHAGVCLYDTRKITAPFLEISAQELRGSRDHASGSESPFICGFDAGTHTGMLGVLFSDGTYTALNVRGRPLLEKPIHVMNAQGTLLPGAFAVHPLRQAMSVGGEILVIH
uniref:Uncharacterized protein TCIL3000_11_590 n=1 Tax=Trypanosoma congolense (strain IL3000) TaxID=1068625 RepID=G0UZ60_TRYCI|nr:unnamed protein product [Trypanosoma congolense IL3000]